MTCAKRNCPQCASVEHTPTERTVEIVWETNTSSSHYEDDGPGRGGYHYTD